MKKLLVILAAVPGVLSAQSLSQRYAVEIDTNKDGAISRAEFQAMSRDHFARADRNRDGKLEGVERPPYLAGKTSVTQQEYVDSAVVVFDGEDRDRNGSLEGEEVKSFWAHMDQGSAKATPAEPHHR